MKRLLTIQYHIWSKIKMWTLIRADRFDISGDHYALSMGEAMKRNDMALLGDCMVGTVPSLTLKLYSDPVKHRSIDPDGHVEFAVQRMNYGDWPSKQPEGEIVEDSLSAVGWRVIRRPKAV